MPYIRGQQPAINHKEEFTFYNSVINVIILNVKGHGGNLALQEVSKYIRTIPSGLYMRTQASNLLLDSVAMYNLQFGELFYYLEWGFTILFTMEYALRIWLTRRIKGYVFSFYGIIDLITILPTYLNLVLLNTHFLVVIRALRLLRVIRILKIGEICFRGQLFYESFKSQ